MKEACAHLSHTVGRTEVTVRYKNHDEARLVDVLHPSALAKVVDTEHRTP
jgi:hypothetical protein